MAATRDPERARRVSDLVAKIKKDPSGLVSSQTISESAFPDNATEEQKIGVIASVELFGKHEWYIGRIYLPDETKWDNGLKCRTRWWAFYGNVSHPDLDQIIDDVRSCIQQAIAAAIAAGLVNPAAAEAAFKAALIACLSGKGIGWANELAIWIHMREEHGGWRWCL